MRIFLLFTLIFVVCLSNGLDECKPATCGRNEPFARFPFWLKDKQSEHCGYPGFELSCTQRGRTQLGFQFPVKISMNNVAVPLKITVLIWSIDYKAQKMLVSNAMAQACLPESLPALTKSSAAFPFEVEAIGYYNEGFTLFNCTDTIGQSYGNPIGCLSSQGYQVIPFGSFYDITSLPPHSSCFKMYNVSFLPDNVFAREEDDYGSTRFHLHWGKPDCRPCEGKGKHCGKNSSTSGEETKCFEHGASRKNHPLALGATVGTVFLVSLSVVLFFLLRSLKRNKENEERIEKALKNHKYMSALMRYSYADIKTITGNFKQKLDKSGSLYKGILDDKTPIAVKAIDGSSINDLINEVDRIAQMHHNNILQLIGYCVHGSKKALVYEALPCGTLDKVLSSDIGKLDWETLQRIATGVAKGILYVHKEHDQETRGLNISPESIFLDHDLNPKVLVCPLQAADQEATGYTAPELLWTSAGIVQREADVYGFGMLMLDILGRMRKIDNGEKERGEVYYPEWIYNEVRNEEEENRVLKKVGGVGLQCIEWFPCDRPSMEAVVQMLQGEGLPVVPPNPFVSS